MISTEQLYDMCRDKNHSMIEQFYSELKVCPITLETLIHKIDHGTINDSIHLVKQIKIIEEVKGAL